MHRHTRFLGMVIVAFVAAFVPAAQLALAQAQPKTGDRVITAVGTATITARPEILRVTVELTGEGSDAKDALAKLEAQKKDARDKLQKLGAPADAVTFADPAMGDKPLNAQQKQMQMIMAMQRGGKKPTTTKSTVTVSSVLTAEVPLKAGTSDELLIAAADLQEKIRDSFKTDAKATTPQEQEVLEEMQGQDAMMAGTGRKPGEPGFLYVHKIAEAKQQKAMNEAFTAAQASAARMAKAAGAQLGDVHTISAWSTSGPSGDDAEQNMYAAMFAGMMGTQKSDSVAAEATSTQPGPVTSRVTVTCGFGIK